MKLLLFALFVGQPALEAHTGKSGTTVFVIGSPTAPVVTPPSLTIVDRNSSPAVLIPGPISSGFWSFRLARPDIRILPGQTLKLTAPAGWVKGAPALSIPVVNYAGQCEFPIGQNPTMALGVNLS